MPTMNDDQKIERCFSQFYSALSFLLLFWRMLFTGRTVDDSAFLFHLRIAFNWLCQLIMLPIKKVSLILLLKRVRIMRLTTSLSTSPTSLTCDKSWSESKARKAPIKNRKFHWCKDTNLSTLSKFGLVHSNVISSRRSAKKSAKTPPISGPRAEKADVTIFFTDK